MKLSEIKSWVKKHAPELIVGATTISGTVGWIAAGVYAARLAETKGGEYNREVMLIVHPTLLREVRDEGATLTHWIGSDGTEHYKTILEDGSGLSQKAYGPVTPVTPED